MRIKIVPPDNRVAIDGVFKTVAMDFPHINAVDFNGETASIEHREHNGEWLPPETISKDEFLARFGNIVLAWENAEADGRQREASAPQLPANVVTREEAEALAAEAASKAVAAFAAEIVKPSGG